jgi:CO/xanthine dehydrogenase FAD-binding subunit
LMSYHRPETLSQALSLLAQGGHQVLAGGTDIYPATIEQTLSNPILNITNIKKLRGITHVKNGWRIGGATPWSDIIAADLPPAFDALKSAATQIGGIQIQNAGTIAGNLCNASPAADGAPPLLVLDAQVELTSSQGKRLLSLRDFITNVRQTALRPDEILTAILIPEASASGTSTFLKLGARRYLVISITMISVRLNITSNHITQAAIAIGACSKTATRLPAIEAALTGAPSSDAARRVDATLLAQSLSPIDDLRASAEYRLSATCELLRRALRELTGAP